nr:hypothetical protein HmN_000587200 [Hymenolepis microstoma]
MFSIDDSLLSCIHSNHLADKDFSDIKSLLEYHQRSDVQHLDIIENWLRHHGFPGAVHGVNFPNDFQRCLSLQDAKLEAGIHRKGKVVHSLGILVECLAHLAGIWNLPGIPRSINLPIENTSFSIGLIYNHLAALIGFAESQGGCVGHVLPEFLMVYEDYKEWIQCGRPGGSEENFKLNIPNESISEIKVITPVVILPSDHGETVHRLPSPTTMDKITFERVSKIAWTSLFLQLLKSLVVGQGAEAKLLQWVSKSVKNSWTRLCEVNEQTEKPMQYAFNRPKVTNFGKDLSNGLALAAVIASYAPFLIGELFLELNLSPQNQEQKFHNAVQIIKSFQILQVDVSITAEEICNPNEVQMVLVLSNLYRTLPEYQIQSEIRLTGKLNAYVLEYLTLTNPTNRKLKYTCFYVGKDAKSFYFNKEPNMKQTHEMELLENESSTLEIGYLVQMARDAEAWLILVSKMGDQATKGLTMVFRLIASASEIQFEKCFNFKTFCYRPVVKVLQICNPFRNEGMFNVRIMESSSCSNRLRGFTCLTKEAKFSQGGQIRLEVVFHPFSVDNYSARLIFSNENLDEFSVELQGYSCYPNLENLKNEEKFSLEHTIGKDRYLTIQLPLKNYLRCEAIKWVADYCISPVESEKESVIEDRSDAASKSLMLNRFEQLSSRKRIRFDVRCDSELFKAPSYVDVEFKKEEDFFEIPLEVSCPKQGIYRAMIFLTAWDDVRVYRLECNVTKDDITSPIKKELNADKGERYFPDPTVFVTEDLERLEKIETSLVHSTFETVIYGGKIEIKCQVRNCKHKTDVLDRHIACILLPKNRTENPQRLNGSGKVEVHLLYHVDILIKPAPPVEQIQFICHSLEANEISFPLNLPTLAKCDGNYQVCLKGITTLEPRLTEDLAYCKLKYHPISIGKEKISVIFFNETSGEFWYDIDLITLPPLPRKAALCSCQLGESCLNAVEIENPVEKSYSLMPEIVNKAVITVESYYVKGASKVFRFDDKSLILPGLSTLCLNVRFRPQEYGKWLNDGEIILSCEELGEIRICLSGEGTMPTVKEEISVQAEIGRHEMIHYDFQNPFPYPVDICSLIKTDSDHVGQLSESVFEIVSKRELHIQGKEGVSFNLKFSPVSMKASKATLCLEVRKKTPEDGGNWHGEKIVWSIPLKGIPIMYGASLEELQLRRQRPCQQSRTHEPLVIEGEVGTSTHLKLHFNLPGFIEDSQENWLFQWRFFINHCYGNDFLDSEFAVQKMIEITQTGCDLVSPLKNIPQVELSAIFTPTRSFRISAFLCIISKTGGVWRFPVILKALQSHKLEQRLQFTTSEPHTPDLRKLHLDSRELKPTEFRAFFEKLEGEEFVLDATEGILPAHGSGYFTLTIKFLKRRGGIPLKKRLVIQTPRLEWIYELTG